MTTTTASSTPTSTTTKSIFTTGSSTGLGRAAALRFANAGWRVIATMRRPEQDTELAKHPNITLLALDVTRPEQIAAVARETLALGPVDVVFNNAGYGLVGPLEGMTDTQIVQEIDTNLLGVIRTTQAFVPYFRERRAGLFIATTSIGGLVTYPFTSLYHATKWALEGFYESLSFELSKFGIGVKTVAPGGIKTDFQGRSLVMAGHPAYEALIGTVFSRLTDPERQARYSTAEQIADVVYEAATDGKDQVCYVAGEDAKATFAQRRAAGDAAFRKGVDQLFFG
jgi:NAD(P)-dependent dehydrogenase (short-subunit alcohol dehydrogenase family)